MVEPGGRVHCKDRAGIQEGRRAGRMESRHYRATGEVISALAVELDGEAPATHLRSSLGGWTATEEAPEGDASLLHVPCVPKHKALGQCHLWGRGEEDKGRGLLVLPLIHSGRLVAGMCPR